MPRVELYPGDRVASTARPGMRRTTTGPPAPPAPTADVFGGQFGETLQRAAQTLSSYVEQQRQEQQARADQYVYNTAETQFNQLFQIQGLSQDRGPVGTKGLLTMVGMEPQDKLEQNLKDYDAQAAEIVKQAKTPEQRLRLEAMREEQRARYHESAGRHAFAESTKAMTGQVVAKLESSVSLAGNAAGTEGGAEVILDQLQAQEDTLMNEGHLLGFHTLAAKQQKIAELRSQTHVLAIGTLISKGMMLDAERYFDRVMATKTDLYPKGEIQPAPADQLRTKLKANTLDAKAMLAVTAVTQKLGPQQGDNTTPVPINDILSELKTMAGTDAALYNRMSAYAYEAERAIEGQRANVAAATEGTLYRLFEEGVPLPTLRTTDAWKNADDATIGKVLRLYKEKDEKAKQDQRQAEADARARAGERRSAQDDQLRTYQIRQAEQGIAANAAYWRLTAPEVLQGFPTRDALRIAILDARLNDAQTAAVYNKYEQVQGSVEGAAAAVTDQDMFKQEAHRAGETYVYSTGLNETQQARIGNLRSLVDAAIAQEEAAQTQAAGRRVRLKVEAQRAVMRAVLSQKVILDHSWWSGGSTEATMALVVNPQDQAIARVPLDKIPPQPLADLINHMRSVRPSLARADDDDIKERHPLALERAYAAFIMRLGDPEMQKRLLETP